MLILQRLQIPDISYTRRTFYNVTKLTGRGSDATPPGINVNTLVVYLDNRDITRAPNLFVKPDPLTVDGSLLIPGATTYTGHFVQLSAGVDYTFDPTIGVITFPECALADRCWSPSTINCRTERRAPVEAPLVVWVPFRANLR